MKYVIDLDVTPVDLNGASLDETFGKVVAQHVLANSAEGPPLKCWEWAQTLYQSKPLSLDTTDFEMFKSLVMSSRAITNLVKGQLHPLLAAVKAE